MWPNATRVKNVATAATSATTRHAQNVYGCRACSRSSYFWILPVDVLGSGPKITVVGALKWARRSRHQAMIVPSSASAPGSR